MGFGRIGRSVFRLIQGHPDLEVAAIADIADPAGLTYLLKYDSIYGRFPIPVELEGSELFVDGSRIPILADREPRDIDWSAHGVDVVVQATTRYRTMIEAGGHIERGAKKVVVASTPTQGDIPILLRGINDHVLAETDVVALGSNTSNALAPILRILDQAFGLERAFFTTVHAMTNTQRLADVPSEGFRQSRAAGENIIPADTNSAEILAAVMPEFAGKLSAVALNVPVPDGSTVDLVAETRDTTTKEAVNAAVKSAAEASYAGIIEYSQDPIVSSDVRTARVSGVYDSLATVVMDGNLIKAITWFNNGWGYSARIIEVVERMASQLRQGVRA
jgi:glyceraldehyde 3-phosphate dehydrogenase